MNGVSVSQVQQPRTPPPPRIYQLQVSLEGISPPIWRQLQVRSDITLHELHKALQLVLGWQDYHLYQFILSTRKGLRYYGEPDPEFPEPHIYQAKRTRLKTVLPTLDEILTYEYDFGDGWRHHLVVEDILEPEPGVRYPRCLAGARSCPPEDCGGPHGYQDLQRILHDPDDEEHEDIVTWAGEGYDPERFDVDVVNAALYVLMDGARR